MESVLKARFLFFILILFVLFSCNSPVKKVLYQFNGVSITRVDVDNSESFFYYGDQTKEEIKVQPNMKIFWGQRDGGFVAYFIFHHDKSVEVTTELGLFSVIRNDPKFYLSIRFDPSDKDFNIDSGDKWYDGIQGNYNNIIYVCSWETEQEKARNEDNKSKVVAKYIDVK